LPPRIPPPRLSVLLAREAPRALILRRGPSKWVEVIAWDTQRDTFEHGAWFHGRIYERRSDLSPDGTKLIYFVNKFTSKTVEDEEYTYAWTAVSKVPYLTALALWPKGNCWWGGGLFQDNYTVFLNHRPSEAGVPGRHLRIASHERVGARGGDDPVSAVHRRPGQHGPSEAAPHPRHPPNRLRVISNPDAAGEDDPLYSQRLTRDGWVVRQAWRWERIGWDGFRTDVPELRVRSHPNTRLAIVLERRLDGLRYREQFALETPNGRGSVDLGGTDWSDWDQAGRLILLRAGKVWAAPVKGSHIAEPSPLIDLTADRPAPRETPRWAEAW